MRDWRTLHLAAVLRRLGFGAQVPAPDVGSVPALPWGSELLPAPADMGAGGAPVRAGGAPAVQADPTTCGAAVLTLLAALGDASLAARLATPGVFADVQGRVHRESTRGGFPWPPPWPRAWGTPPWGAARVARFGPVRYRAVLVDDARPDRVVDAVEAALDRGVPVPLYTGGDLGHGPTAAVPRHVVLALARRGPRWLVYEPSSGRVLGASAAAMRRPAAGARDAGTRVALGGWTRLCWVLLPAPRAGSSWHAVPRAV